MALWLHVDATNFMKQISKRNSIGDIRNGIMIETIISVAVVQMSILRFFVNPTNATKMPKKQIVLFQIAHLIVLRHCKRIGIYPEIR